MKHFFTGFCFLLFTTNFSQNYKVIDTADYTERNAFVEDFKAHNKLFINKLKKEYSGKTSRSLSTTYEEFQTIFVDEINDKKFTFKSGLEKSIQDIITELRNNNSGIPENIRVLISKSNYPNAYCLADGTFVINMGLFNWIENRAQMAAVVSHELAHALLEHNLKMQLKSINENLENKNEIKQIQAQKYDKSSKALSFLKNHLYEKSELKRKHEVEADSLGYALYKKTKFKSAEYINALRNLAEFDTIAPTEVKIETYKKLYDLPNLKFNEKWLKSEDFSVYNYNNYKEKINKDSIASHPEMTDRILKLKSVFKELEKDENAADADDEFAKMRTITKMEIFPNFSHSEDIGTGIYVVMQCFQRENTPEEIAYYKEWLGKYFERIYDARKTYKLNRYVDTINPKEQSKSYQQFLNFIWNLKLDEIKAIADFYSKK